MPFLYSHVVEHCSLQLNSNKYFLVRERFIVATAFMEAKPLWNLKRIERIECLYTNEPFS